MTDKRASTSLGDHTASSNAPAPPLEPEAGTYDRMSRFFQRYTGVALPAAQTLDKQTLTAERRKADIKKCVENRDYLMRNNPIIVFMLDEMEKLGCPFKREHIRCTPCDDLRSGGFSPDRGIQLCANHFMSTSHMKVTLAHELVHAYDHCRFNMDLSNCLHHACTEIRAASLSGDCNIIREMNRRNYALSKQHQACVKRRAILSLKANPCCSAPGAAEEAVNKVFKSCFRDTRPFDEIYFGF
ncbi:Mitochondrial inner membrane protease atp23 [Tieghemiomyces parasiticus]|uniref:Mitochondrial inner membrane protease ATP23 n=1 Tax=Tieghemiomyces parasiticus TaxID=78921 RepID=A0A9W8DV69_9FUNG|nr:Mitochondrial inner membrane protease atp23 [Tieghemiomyces parasiticus]